MDESIDLMSGVEGSGSFTGKSMTVGKSSPSTSKVKRVATSIWKKLKSGLSKIAKWSWRGSARLACTEFSGKEVNTIYRQALRELSGNDVLTNTCYQMIKSVCAGKSEEETKRIELAFSHRLFELAVQVKKRFPEREKSVNPYRFRLKMVMLLLEELGMDSKDFERVLSSFQKGSVTESDLTNLKKMFRSYGTRFFELLKESKKKDPALFKEVKWAENLLPLEKVATTVIPNILMDFVGAVANPENSKYALQALEELPMKQQATHVGVGVLKKAWLVASMYLANLKTFQNLSFGKTAYQGLVKKLGAGGIAAGYDKFKEPAIRALVQKAPQLFSFLMTFCTEDIGAASLLQGKDPFSHLILFLLAGRFEKENLLRSQLEEQGYQPKERIPIELSVAQTIKEKSLDKLSNVFALFGILPDREIHKRQVQESGLSYAIGHFAGLSTKKLRETLANQENEQAIGSSIEQSLLNLGMPIAEDTRKSLVSTLQKSALSKNEEIEVLWTGLQKEIEGAFAFLANRMFTIAPQMRRGNITKGEEMNKRGLDPQFLTKAAVHLMQTTTNYLSSKHKSVDSRDYKEVPTVQESASQLLNTLFPQKAKDLPLPKVLQGQVWKTLEQKLVPCVLEQVTDIIDDPSRRTAMALRFARRWKRCLHENEEMIFDDRVDALSLEKSKKLLQKELQQILSIETDRYFKGVWKQVQGKIDSWTERFFGSYSESVKKVVRQTVAFLVLNRIMQTLLSPLIQLAEYGWQRYTASVSKNWVDLLSGDELNGLGKTLLASVIEEFPQQFIEQEGELMENAAAELIREINSFGGALPLKTPPVSRKIGTWARDRWQQSLEETTCSDWVNQLQQMHIL